MKFIGKGSVTITTGIFLGTLLAYSILHDPVREFLVNYLSLNLFFRSKPQLIIALVGAPGSGKTTLADQGVARLKFFKFSIGDLAREISASNNESRTLLDDNLRDGLVPDSTIMSLFEKRLVQWSLEHPSVMTLILDGFPRTEQQATMFLEFLKLKLPRVKFRVVELQITDDDSRSRLKDRRVCLNESCQAVYSHTLLGNKTKCPLCGGELKEDDGRATRLDDYHKTIEPLREVYRNATVRIDTINVTKQTAEEVFVKFKKLF